MTLLAAGQGRAEDGAPAQGVPAEGRARRDRRAREAGPRRPQGLPAVVTDGAVGQLRTAAAGHSSMQPAV